MNFFKLNTNKFSGHNKVFKITALGMLLALVFVIHAVTDYFQWTTPSFLHFDFSLIPIVVALFIFDFWTALLLLALRLGFALLLSHDGIAFWYGPLMQMQVALISIIVLAVTYKPLLRIIKRPAIALCTSLILSVLFEVIYSSLMNWSWSTPLYLKLLGSYKGNINPFDFADWYSKSGFIQAFMGGFKSWHVAAWGAFGPFNLIKFGVVAVASFPLIKVTYVYFTGQRMTSHKVSTSKVIDTHVHLGWTEDSHIMLINASLRNNVEMVAVSSSIEDMERTAKVAMANGIRFGLGVAYNFKKGMNIDNGIAIMNKYKHKMSIVGEIGIDYEQHPNTKNKQKEIFKAQLIFAKENSLPASIHGKGESYIDILNIINEVNFENKVIMHNYNGDIEMTELLMKHKNVYFSFGNQAFYKGYEHALKSAKIIPLSRILIETDSPGFPTVDNLGKVEFDKQDSSNIIYVAEHLSKIKDVSKDKLIKKSNKNINKILAS